MASFLSSEPPSEVHLSAPPGKPGPWMPACGGISPVSEAFPPPPSSQLPVLPAHHPGKGAASPAPALVQVKTSSEKRASILDSFVLNVHH